MAERASMKDLIDLTRRLVAEPEGEAPGREDIQASLDGLRVEARYEALTAVPTVSGGSVVYQVFDAALPYWETDGVLYDAAYDVLTPTVADWTRGRWTFAAAPAQPVTLLGWQHDPYLAAADLLEIRAAHVAEGYDFTAGPDSFKRSQRQKQLLEMAGRYRAMSPRARAIEAAAAAEPMPEVKVHVFAF